MAHLQTRIAIIIGVPERGFDWNSLIEPTLASKWS